MTDGTGWDDMKKYLNIIIACAALILGALPFFMKRDAAFRGTDSGASEIIREMSPQTGTGRAPLWSPPGPEMETLLFSLQAAAGSGIVCFIIGYYVGKRKRG